MRSKIAVIGAGFVGATTAHLLAVAALGDVVLLDIDEGIAKGKALDLLQSLAVKGIDVKVKGTADYKDIAGSDIVVVTAGLARKPGMSRDELLAANAKIIASVCENVKKHAPNAILIMVTNPLDAMVYLAWKTTGFPVQRVMGMAGVLDSGRMRTFIGEELNVPASEVEASVMGGHGDTMVPLMRYAKVGGRPLANLIPQEKIDQIVKRTRDGGAEIVSLLKTGSAYYAPASAAVEMIDAILKNKKTVMSCCAYLSGQYGVNGLFIGVPVVLGSKGVEKVVEIELNDEEKAQFDNTAKSVKELVAAFG